jgi:hypothetical protein
VTRQFTGTPEGYSASNTCPQRPAFTADMTPAMDGQRKSRMRPIPGCKKSDITKANVTMIKLQEDATFPCCSTHAAYAFNTYRL